MRTFAIGCCLSVGLATGVPSATAARERDVTICHVATRTRDVVKTMRVPASRVDEHLDHGDALGDCRRLRDTDPWIATILRMPGIGDRDDDRRRRTDERDDDRDRDADRRVDDRDRDDDDDRDERRARAQEWEKKLDERRRELAKAREERDRELAKAEGEAAREDDRRKAAQKYAAKRGEILEKYYDKVRQIRSKD